MSRQESVVQGADPYLGSQRAVEPKSDHSASYKGRYASKGEFARGTPKEQQR